MTFIHQNKHYHICVQYWHNSEPTNHYSRKVTDILCSEPESYMSQCPLCLSPTHETNHLFYCSQVLTQYNTISLWKKALEAAEVIQKWESRLASLRG